MSKQQPPRRENRKSPARGDGSTKLVRIEIPKEIGTVAYANHILVNYTGNEFVVTVMAAVPPPFGNNDELPDKITADVIGRYAFNIPRWVQAVKSFGEQIDRLEASGQLKIEEEEPEPEADDGN